MFKMVKMVKLKKVQIEKCSNSKIQNEFYWIRCKKSGFYSIEKVVWKDFNVFKEREATFSMCSMSEAPFSMCSMSEAPFSMRSMSERHLFKCVQTQKFTWISSFSQIGQKDFEISCQLNKFDRREPWLGTHGEDGGAMCKGMVRIITNE